MKALVVNMPVEMFTEKEFGVVSWIDTMYQAMSTDLDLPDGNGKLALLFEDQVALDLNEMGRCTTYPLKGSFLITLCFKGRLRILATLAIDEKGLENTVEMLEALLEQGEEIAIYETKRYYDADTQEVLGMTQVRTMIQPKALELVVWKVDDLLDFIDAKTLKSPDDVSTITLSEEKRIASPVPSGKKPTHH